jgi:hypothetical protein
MIDLVATYHDWSEALIAATGASHATLHVSVGMGLFLLVQLLVDDRRASAFALAAVAYAEVTNEVLQFLYHGSWRWADTLGDIGATLFWPAAVLFVGTSRRRRWARRHAQAVAITSRLVPSR